MYAGKLTYWFLSEKHAFMPATATHSHFLANVWKWPWNPKFQMSPSRFDSKISILRYQWIILFRFRSNSDRNIDSMENFP